MKKVTKKEPVERANEQELRIYRIEQALKQSGIEWVTTEPKLKQLDQSVFNHEYVTDHFKYAAINDNGQSIFFSDKPKCNLELGIWYSTAGSTMTMLKGYDATDWQNSLIERKELTGSDLCRAMLARGDEYVMCIVSNHGDAINIDSVIFPKVVCKFNEHSFITTDSKWPYAVPINNHGEPLTQSDAGL